MSIDTLLWIGTFGMVIGATLIFLVGKQRTPQEQTHLIITGIVSVIAACSYFAMATGQGVAVLSDPRYVDTGHVFFFARYIDWLFTTPLLLIGLGLTATHGIAKRPGVIAGLVLSDLIMIVTALFFGMSVVPWIKWTWFAISCGAFLAVYYGIWIQLKTVNVLARDDARKYFKTQAVFLSVIWFLYPVILALGTDGISIISPVLTTLIILILDLVAKGVFGFSATKAMGKITDKDLIEAPL